jgi:hypothetical protein
MQMNRIRFNARVRNFVVGVSRRVLTAFALITFIPAAALAQYPGGGPAPSYGSKGAVVGGVAAAAAVGAGLLYWKSRHHATLQGCVAGDGNKLVAEKGTQTYKLTQKQDQALPVGERVVLQGKKARDAAGEPVFEVHKLSKDLGQCSTTTAAAAKAAN